MDLTGKQVVVTAAAQGIGRATAEAFADAGARVWAVDIDTKQLGKLKNKPGLTTYKLDVREDGEVTKFAAKAGTIDILFNCVGHVHNGSVLECTANDLDDAFDLNVKSMYRTITAFLPGMIEKGEGSIVNMASVCGSVKGVPSRFAYGVTKAAVVGLTKSVATDYISKGIRCNAICPGTVETPSLEERLHAMGNYDQARADFISRQPIGRIGQPKEIADLVVYLATATYTTGQIHVIDGGWTA
jgi:2-keto-3-deoxy-L-fuconate dehydrogenase